MDKMKRGQILRIKLRYLDTEDDIINLIYVLWGSDDTLSKSAVLYGETEA